MLTLSSAEREFVSNIIALVLTLQRELSDHGLLLRQGPAQGLGNGYHLNEHYALDFAILGVGCWKRLYPICDGMTVTKVDTDVIEMQKTISGERYRLR